ncbi:MAG: protein kinase [Planctomycetota bacterium]|nr:protein kinase [Planctomycetota bacterium]
MDEGRTTTDDSSSSGGQQSELDRLAEEFVERERRGEQPSITEYVRAHPELAEGIEEIFPLLSAMEDARLGRPELETPPKKELDDYRLLREIGRGGMGVVYEAEQKTLGRRVALKILPTRATLDPRFLERFRLEAQAAAKLQHPNIVPVIGYGEDDGVHYFTMQYIEGRGLDDVILEARARLEAHEESVGRADSTMLGPTWFKDVARIGLQAAEAIAHAHAHGVLHRDVKPSNLMLDEDDKVWVTDFGLCKEEGSGNLTQPGDLLGTFRYMPPERFRGESDVKGDIYGLGITLYELLTRTPAYEDDARAALAARIVREAPKRPRIHDPRIPPDLETIVMKAMAHDPDVRYPTADALAEDLRAFIDGRPIAARTPSLGYLLRVAVRRHRALAFTLTAAVVVLVAASVFYVVSVREKEADARFRHYVANIAAAETALRDRQVFVAKRLLDEAPAEHRNFEWHHLRSRLDRSVREFPRNEDIAERAAYSPDGAWLIVQAGGSTRVYDAETTKETKRIEHAGFVRGVSWHTSGDRFALATSDRIEVWSWPDAEKIAELPGEHYRAVAYAPDGRTLVSGGHGGRLVVRDATSLEVLREIDVHSQIYGLAWSPSGNRIVTGTWDGRVSVWTPTDDVPIWWARASDRGLAGVAFVGEDLVAAAVDGVVQLWRSDTGEPVRSLAQGGFVRGVWSSAPDWRLYVGAGQQIHIWEPKTWSRAATWLHDGEVQWVALHPDGTRLAACSTRGSVKEWLRQRGDPDLLAGHIGGVPALAYAPSGQWIATADEARVVRLWDATSGQLARAWLGHVATPVCMTFSWDSQLLITGDYLGNVVVRSVTDGRVVLAFEAYDGWLPSIGISRDDRRIITVGHDGKLRTFDAQTGKPLREVRISSTRLQSVCVSADGRYIATGDHAGAVCIRDARTLDVVREFKEHGEPVMAIAFQPGSRRLASVSYDRTVRVWDMGRDSSLFALRAHREESARYPDVLRCVAFTPDGTRIAAGSHDASVMLWDVSSGQLVATLRGYRGWVTGVAFSPDGTSLVAASGVTRVSPTRPFRERLGSIGADRTTRTAAAALLTELESEHTDVDALIEAIESTDGVEAEVRETALRVAHRRRGTPEALIARLWRDLVPREREASLRLVARSIAAGLSRAAGHQGRQDSRCETLLCLGAYRCGDPHLVIHMRDQVEALNKVRHPSLFAVDLAVLAMSYAEVEQVDEAVEVLGRLDALLETSPALRDARVASLHAEAHEVVDAAK